METPSNLRYVYLNTPWLNSTVQTCSMLLVLNNWVTSQSPKVSYKCSPTRKGSVHKQCCVVSEAPSSPHKSGLVLIKQQQCWDQTSCRWVKGFKCAQRAPGRLPVGLVSDERIEIFLRYRFDTNFTILWRFSVSTLLSAHATVCVCVCRCDWGNVWVCQRLYEKQRQGGTRLKCQKEGHEYRNEWIDGYKDSEGENEAEWCERGWWGPSWGDSAPLLHLPVLLRKSATCTMTHKLLRRQPAESEETSVYIWLCITIFSFYFPNSVHLLSPAQPSSRPRSAFTALCVQLSDPAPHVPYSHCWMHLYPLCSFLCGP